MDENSKIQIRKQDEGKEEQENRKCRIWEWEEETSEQSQKGFERGIRHKGNWKENVVKILGENGFYGEWTKELEVVEKRMRQSKKCEFYVDVK